MGLLSDVCQYSSMFMLVSVLVSRVPSSAPITENKTFHARDLLAVLFWPPPRFIFRPNQCRSTIASKLTKISERSKALVGAIH